MHRKNILLMAKQLFVRSLSSEEMDILNNYIKNGLDYQIIRAKIVLYSKDSYGAEEIAKLLNIHSNNVRKWIKQFNKLGLSMILHKNRGKKPRQLFTKNDKDKIASLALEKPRELGLKFTTWSLLSLSKYLKDNKIVRKISIESLRQILLGKGISFKKSKQWLHSTDINYQQKKEDVLSLYNNPPVDSVVLCFDEKGSITAKDYQGKNWTDKEEKIKIHYKIRGKTEMFASYNPISGEVLLMFEEKKDQ